MASLEERLAVLEQRFNELHDLIHSGPSVPWPKSLRGRLHDVEQVIRAADNLAQAARELRRTQRRGWSNRRQRVLVLCAIAAAAAPYVLFAVHAR